VQIPQMHSAVVTLVLAGQRGGQGLDRSRANRIGSYSARGAARLIRLLECGRTRATALWPKESRRRECWNHGEAELCSAVRSVRSSSGAGTLAGRSRLSLCMVLHKPPASPLDPC